MATLLILSSIIGSLLLCRALFGPFQRLTAFHIFVLAFIALQSIGSLRLVDEANDTFVLLQTLTMPVVLIAGRGILLLYGDPRVPTTSRERTLAARTKTPLSVAVINKGPLITLGLIALTALFVIDRGTDSISLFYTILNPGDRLTSMNLRMTHFGSRFGAPFTISYSYAKTIFVPMYAAALYTLYKQGFLSWRWMSLGVGFAIFYVALSLEKAPIAYIAFIVIVTHHIVGSSFGVRVMLFSFLGVFVLPAAIYPLIAFESFGIEVYQYMIDNFMRRIFDVNASGSLLYTQLFPVRLEFSGWASNRIMAMLFGVEPVHRPSMLAEMFFSDYYVSSGSLPAGFHISFYADWGMYTCFVFIAGAGAAIGFVEVLIRRYMHGVVGVSVRAVVSLAVSLLMISDFYSVALGRGLISLPLVVLAATTLVPRVQRLVRTSRPPSVYA